MLDFLVPVFHPLNINSSWAGTLFVLSHLLLLACNRCSENISHMKFFVAGTDTTPVTKSLLSDLHCLEEETSRKISFIFKNSLKVQWWCTVVEFLHGSRALFPVKPPRYLYSKIGDLIRDLVIQWIDCALKLNTKNQTEMKVVPGSIHRHCY